MQRFYVNYRKQRNLKLVNYRIMAQVKTFDPRVLELVLMDQKAELDAKRERRLCARPEEALVDLNSTQAQVVIGVRRSGKSTLCFLALEHAGVHYARF